MKITKAKPTWIITLLLASGALAYTFLLFLPNQRKIRELRQQQQTMVDYVMQTAETQKSIERVENNIQKAHEFVAGWEAASPRESQLASIYSSLNEQSRISGANVVQLEPQPTKHLDVVWQAPVGLTLEGDFEQLFDFLRKIESLPQTVWVRELEFMPVRQDTSKLKCEIMLAVFAANHKNSD